MKKGHSSKVIGTTAAAKAVGVSRVAILYLARGAGIRPVGKVVKGRFTYTFTKDQIEEMKVKARAE